MFWLQVFYFTFYDLYRCYECQVVYDGKLTQPIQINSGMKQGCNLSPTGFQLALDRMVRDVLQGRKRGIRWGLHGRHVTKPTHAHTPTHYKTHTYTDQHITKPTHTHTNILQNPHIRTLPNIHTPTHYKTHIYAHTHTYTHLHITKPTHTHTPTHIFEFVH